MPSSVIRPFIVVMICVFLPGCFGFSFWFERLDTLAVWRLDKMLKLSGRQENILRPEVIEFRESLREDTLPDITVGLSNVKRFVG